MAQPGAWPGGFGGQGGLPAQSGRFEAIQASHNLRLRAEPGDGYHRFAP